MTEKKVSARDCLFKRDEGSFKKSMETIEQYCIERGLQLTPVRKKVFEFLLDEPRGLGAYKILDLLRLSGFNSQPPAAYRALDFLVENGFAHKVESQNLFVACTKPGSHHSPVFMICKKCGFKLACPNCSIYLTYQKTDQNLICHHCGNKKKVKKIIPDA